MAVSLTGIGVTLPSVGVSLTPTTLQLPWSGESILGAGVSIPGSTTVPSTIPLVYTPSWPYYGF